MNSYHALAIREATEDDLEAVRQIYTHWVTESYGSFETEPPDPAAIYARWQSIRDAGLPYLVAEADDGTVIGFAYASSFRPCPAYGYTVEDSVYLAPGYSGHGAGRALLSALIERCTALGYRQMIAVIGGSDNASSIRAHAALGFKPVGTLRSVGWKHGQWVDVVLMQRSLGEGDATPAGKPPGPS